MPRARQWPRRYAPGSRLVHFRRIPGTRSYYDPNTYARSFTKPTGKEQRFTEYWVTKVYRPSRDQFERAEIRTRSQGYRESAARHRAQLHRMYMMKLEADGRKPTTPEERQAAEGRFRELHAQLLTASHEYRMMVGERTDLAQPGGVLETTLVELGMRKEGWDRPVGSSPEGHAENVMVPFLRSQIAGR